MVAVARGFTVFRRVALGLLVGTAYLTASSAIGLSAPSVPYELRSAILIRAISYEKTLASRTGRAVIAIVGGPSGDSAEDAGEMSAVFERLAGRTMVANRPATVVRVTYDSKTKLQAALSAQHAEVVYVAPGLSSVIPDIPIREGAVVRIIICGDGDDIERGCALAVTRADNKPQLLLNVKHANAAGLRFAPQLLRLARIID
jgi:YfiR/HmsC-like